jgi:hypothetical protein
MKLPHRFQFLLAAATLGATGCNPAAADVIPVKPEDGSKHFAAVSKHLELGGLFFAYVDIDGDFAKLAALGDRFIDIARNETAEIPNDLSAAKIAEALGLNCVKAIGMSSRGLGKDLYHNRALLYMPEGPKGLMKLFGGKAAPFRIASFASADAGIAVQADLTLSALLETAEGVIRATGQPDALLKYKAGLSFPVPGLNMSVGELIGKLNTRVMFTARFEEGEKLNLPGAPFVIPGVRFMIAMDDIDFVMKPLLAMLGESDIATVEQGDGVTVIRPNSPLPGDLEYFQPALYHDQKNRRIIVTSHLDMAKEAGKGATLGSSAEFKNAVNGLTAEGNGLTYVTPQFMKQFLDACTGIMKQTMKLGGTPAPMEEIMDVIFDLFPPLPAPVASVYANVPEGMLFMSNLNENHKHTIVQATVFPVAILAAGAFAGYATTTQRARVERAEAERAELRKADEAGGDESPAKAVKNNLQQIAFAAQTYFIDNPKQKEVTYEALVKAELIFDLDPVAGESYKGLTLKRSGGEIRVKTTGGDDIGFKYQATDE